MRKNLLIFIIIAASAYIYYFELDNEIIFSGATGAVPPVDDDFEKNIAKCLDFSIREAEAVFSRLKFKIEINPKNHSIWLIQDFGTCLKRIGLKSNHESVKARVFEQRSFLLENSYMPQLYGLDITKNALNEKNQLINYYAYIYPRTKRKYSQAELLHMCKNNQDLSTRKLHYLCTNLNFNNPESCYKYKDRSDLLSLMEESVMCKSLK